MRLPTPGVPVDEFSEEYPHIEGIFSRFFPSRRGITRKEIMAGAAVRVEGSDGWYSPSSIARALLDDVYRPNTPGPAGSPMWERVNPPWWGYGFLADAVFVDVRRAYESILRAFGIRNGAPMQYWGSDPVWYPPDPFWYGPGEKHVLRVLPSSGLSRTMRLVKGPGDVRKLRQPPKDYRPWGTVVTVLHAVAWLAERLGAIYWNVDGGILPRQAAGEFRDAVSSLGLSLQVKGEGPALVRGRGIYSIGRLSSIPFRLGVMGWERDDGQGEFRSWAASVVWGSVGVATLWRVGEVSAIKQIMEV